MITEEILKWITTLPKWEQKLAYQIVEKKQVTEDFLKEVYDIFKIENKLSEGLLPDVEGRPCPMDADNTPAVIWQGVGNLHGVNKLKSNAKLEVSEGLTTVYGENGSGKSGYTRLLNNAFISRGDQEILPNIFTDNPEAVSADFRFLIDGNSVEYKFPECKGEYAFKTIRIFDAKSASDDMTRESTIDFAPSELQFFDELLSACLKIQKLLDAEKIEKKTENPTLKFFQNEGMALTYMRGISSDTNIEDIKSAFNVSENEKKKYEEIKFEKAKLIALNINRQTSIMDQVIDFLKAAERRYKLFEKAVSEENKDIYREQIRFLKKSKIVHDTDGLALFSEDSIEKLGSGEWKEFILSAKKYYDEISNHDKCPLCGHEISEKDLIHKYWKYLESDAEANLKVAKEAIQISKNSLNNLQLTFLVESSIQEQWLLENFKSETEIISTSFSNAKSVRDKLLEAIDNENEITETSIPVKVDIQGLISKIIGKKEALNQESINARINECTKIENEYVDKTKVIELLPVIQTYIEGLKWEMLAEKCKIKTRSITTKQKELFEKYVTDDYLKTFEEECGKLNARFDIKIVSRGSSGQTLKKLQIMGKAPGKVLSEGEQRAIAIANFLTEVQMDTRNVGIVLDDPVCSLDHKRRSFIVRRLLEEAKKRQVVIFTHEITFFMELKTEAERNGVIFKQATIRKMCDEPGDISPIIPWHGMNVKDRIGKLKNELQGVEAVFNSGNMEEYYYKAKGWCELLRESWERAVEEVLFNDAIQRYNPCVQTQRLKKAPFTQELYAELERGMTECSSWCHDQARAINGNVPTADELRQYMDCFEQYYKKNHPK